MLDALGRWYDRAQRAVLVHHGRGVTSLAHVDPHEVLAHSPSSAYHRCVLAGASWLLSPNPHSAQCVVVCHQMLDLGSRLGRERRSSELGQGSSRISVVSRLTASPHLLSSPSSVPHSATTVHDTSRNRALELIGRRFESGAGFGADSERLPVTTVLWAYQGVRQGERQMRRVGAAA